MPKRGPGFLEHAATTLEFIQLQFSRPTSYAPFTREGTMANFKRKGPKSTRSGCLLCKPHKRQGAKCEHTARETAKRQAAADDIRMGDTGR